MSTDHLVSFQDETLERLRALLVFQEQLASPSFRGLVDAVDNAELAHALDVMAWDARRQQRDLEEVITLLIDREAETDARDRRARRGRVSHRDIVESWLEITETSAEVYRSAAEAAGDPVARMKLERLAMQEEHHARMFRNLL